MAKSNSILSFVSEKCSKSNIPILAITLDQPSYVKTYEIALSTKMNILVRLGSLGYLIDRKGLMTALETVHAPSHSYSDASYKKWCYKGHEVSYRSYV